MTLKKTQRSNLEKVILLTVFLGLLAFVAANFFKERKIVKQQSLYHQLAILRQGINMYQMMEKKNPENLIDLAMATYKLPDDDRIYKFVETIEMDDEGRMVDPFENPYDYDPNTAWVHSTTPGFMDW